MSTYFYARIPLAGQDQDAPPISNDRFLIICDGLGGDGSAKHHNKKAKELYENKSAYLGSRELSKICEDFFEKNYDALLSENDKKSQFENLKQKIKDGLTESLSKYPKLEDSKGGMVFPTTLAAVLYKEEADCVNATIIWSGDSRIYLFTEDKWLQQLSEDDVIGDFDACFGKDCRMSNCISQDEPFFINYASYKLPKNCVVFACSDGCFDFTESPMHFELKILNALYDAKDISTDGLKNSFSKVFGEMMPGDDCSLAGVVFGFEANGLKNSIAHRVKPLQSLITQFRNAENIYKKITNEKRTEIRTLISENKRLNQEIVSKQRDTILSAFREEISEKDETSKDKNLLKISLLLKDSYPPYVAYLTELNLISEKIKENQKSISEYKSCYDKLKSLVDVAERRKRLKEKKEKWNHIPIYNIGQQFISSFGTKTIFAFNSEPVSIKRSECIMYIEELERLLNSIKQNIEANTAPAISEQISNLTNKITHTLSEINASISQNSYNDEKIMATILMEDELNKEIMPSVVKSGVAQYQTCIDENMFETMLASYEELKSFELKLKSIETNEEKEKTFEEKSKDFEMTFLKIHLIKMSEILMNFDGIDLYIPALAKYQNNVEQLNAIQRDLDGVKDAQRQVWSEYKGNYELYKKCSCCEEV